MFWFKRRKVSQSEYLVKNIRFDAYQNDRSGRACAGHVEIGARARHNRVRHTRWDPRGYCHRCHNAFPTEASRIMGCHCRRDKWSLRSRRRSLGQSTVEFAVVTAGLLALVIALGVLWRALDQGLLVEHALSAASHHLVEVPAAFIADIFRF